MLKSTASGRVENTTSIVTAIVTIDFCDCNERRDRIDKEFAVFSSLLIIPKVGRDSVKSGAGVIREIYNNLLKCPDVAG